MHWKAIIPMLGVLVVLFSDCGAASQKVPTATASPHLQIATYSAMARVQTGKVTAVSVSCKPGEQMLGGGFKSLDLFEYAALIDASYPSSATTWTVTAAPAPSFLVEAEVYCFPALVPLDMHIVRATGSPAGRVACPQRTVLLGGGYQSSRPIGVSHPQDNGWMSASVGASIRSMPSVLQVTSCAARWSPRSSMRTPPPIAMPQRVGAWSARQDRSRPGADSRAKT